MTVKQLIAELKKMPSGAPVYYQDFDSDPYGMSSAPNEVFILDFTNLPDFEESQNEFKLKGKVVVLKG